MDMFADASAGNVTELPTGNGVDTGPILPVNAEFAAAVRAAHRKEVDALQVGEQLDISIPDDLEFAEIGMDGEDAELRFTDDGTLIEPFNLWAERSAGYFDSEENYVARVNKDDTDAWLQALEDSEGVVKGGGPTSSFQARQTARKAAKQMPEMQSADRAEYKQRIVQRLRAGENVLEALKRLGTKDHRPPPAGATKTERLAVLRSKLAGTVPVENRSAFDTLTEAAGELLGAGDANVYSKPREALIVDIKRDLRAALQGSSAASTSGRTSARQGQASVSSRTAVNNAQDSTNATPAGDLQQPAEQNARVPPQATMMDIDEQGPARHPDLTESEPPNTPNKKRKTVDSNTGGRSAGRSVSLADPQPTGVSGTEDTNLSSNSTAPSASQDISAGANVEPSGFILDPTSGMYYNSELGCFYDLERKLYRDAGTGRWYRYTENGYEHVEA